MSAADRIGDAGFADRLHPNAAGDCFLHAVAANNEGAALTTCPPIHWAIITGEYPSQPGGVADYTHQVAHALASAGDMVTVYAPAWDTATGDEAPGVVRVRLPDHFGLRGLVALDRALACTRPDRILIQYVPHAYGYKAMNLAFTLWVATRAQLLAPLWVMFHEVAFPFSRRPVKHALLGAVTRAMARLVAGAAERVFISTAAWAPLLNRLCPQAKPAEWLPIPSNVPDFAEVESIRSASGIVIGHFGTYGPATVGLLEPALVQLLNESQERSTVLLGRGGLAFRDAMASRQPALGGRLVALGESTPEELAARLRGCDILLQPFIDGISSRRTSAMAGLANGVPVVTNLGELSDALWRSLGWSSLAPIPDPDALASAASAVLSHSPAERVALGEAGAALYRERFSLANTIATLRSPVRVSCRVLALEGAR